MIKKGQTVKARGGWEAIIVWIPSNAWPSRRGFYAVHKPRTLDESVPIYHHNDGTTGAVFSVTEPPSYGLHPADIIFEGE